MMNNPEVGQFIKINIPKSKVIMPLNNVQLDPGAPANAEKAIRKTPTAI